MQNNFLIVNVDTMKIPALILIFSVICWATNAQELYTLESPDSVSLVTGGVSIDGNDYPYLTAKVHVVANKSTLSSKFFRGKWYKKIKTFYVYGTLQNPAIQTNTSSLSVPIFYIDMKKSTSQQIEQFRVINKLPYRVDSRDVPYIKLNFQSITSNFEDFQKIMSAADEVINNTQLSSVISTSGAGAALNTVIDITSKLFPVSEDVSDINRFVNPPALDSNQISARIFLIVPPVTEKNAKEYERERLKNFELRRKTDDSGDLLAFVSNKAYTKLPYIIIEFIPSFYVSDVTNLFVEDFPSSLDFDDSKIFNVKSFLESEIATSYLTDKQLKHEQNLLFLIESYKSFRDLSLAFQATTNIDDKASILTNYVNSVIQYLKVENRIKTDTTDFIYKNKYKERIEFVINGIEDLLKPDAGFIRVKTISDYQDFANNYSLESIDTSRISQDSILNGMYEIKRVMSYLKKPLSRTSLYDWALNEIYKLESFIYENRFEDKVNEIANCSGDLADLQKLRQDVQNEQFETQCKICDEQLKLALSRCTKLTTDNLTDLFNETKKSLSIEKFKLNSYSRSPSLLNITDTIEQQQFTLKAQIVIHEIDAEMSRYDKPPDRTNNLNQANTRMALLIERSTRLIGKLEESEEQQAR